MTNSRFSRLTAFVLACSLFAQSASAQINEADRLQRCENNREAIAGVQNELIASGYMTDEQIARARSALVSLRRESVNQAQAYEDSFIRSVPGALDRYNSAAAAQRAAGSSVGLYCLSTNTACIYSLAPTVARMIDTAVAVRQSSQPALQRLAGLQTNLIALGCEQGPATTWNFTAQPDNPTQGSTPSTPSTPTAGTAAAQIAGRYYSLSNYRYYRVSQEGTNFAFQSEDGVESGTGSITIWPMYQRLTATVTGPNGTQNITGHVTMSGVDRSQVWMLDWAMGYGPWQRRP